MPLNTPELRRDGFATKRAPHLGQIARASGEGPKLLGEIAPDDVQVSTQHRVFALLVRTSRPAAAWRRRSRWAGDSCWSPAAMCSPAPRSPKRRTAPSPPTFYKGSSVGATATAVKAASSPAAAPACRVRPPTPADSRAYQMALWLHSPTPTCSSRWHPLRSGERARSPHRRCSSESSPPAPRTSEPASPRPGIGLTPPGGHRSQRRWA